MTALLFTIGFCRHKASVTQQLDPRENKNTFYLHKNDPSCFCKHKKQSRGHLQFPSAKNTTFNVVANSQHRSINSIGLHYTWIPQINMLNHQEKAKRGHDVSLQMDKTQADKRERFHWGVRRLFKAMQALDIKSIHQSSRQSVYYTFKPSVFLRNKLHSCTVRSPCWIPIEKFPSSFSIFHPFSQKLTAYRHRTPESV